MNTSGIDFAELVGVDEPSETIVNDRKMSKTSSMGSTFHSPSIDLENNSVTKFDEGVELEASSKGKVKGSLFVSYFRAGANWPVLCIIIFLFVFAQMLGSAVDYFVSYWQVILALE